MVWFGMEPRVTLSALIGFELFCALPDIDAHYRTAS